MIGIPIYNIYRQMPKKTFLILSMIAFLTLLAIRSSHAQESRYLDALGREVILQSEPKRIIALAPSITEILYFIGLGDRVVGVTRYSNYPPDTKNKPKVGSYIDLNVEKIIDLAPDLVIGTIDGNRKSVVDLLEQANIQVFITNPTKIEGIIETIAEVGRVCGVKEKAESLADDLSKRIKRVYNEVGKLARPGVFLQINLKPIMTVNRDTFLNDLIQAAGGRNLAENEPIAYPRLSLEEVIQRKPEIIIISSMERSGQFEQARQNWLKWKNIPAVQNGRVYLIDSDLIDRPSPRIILGLEIMARMIHPEIKWD